MPPPTYKHTERDLITHSPRKANVEPFFKCIKESKGLPLQTTASGSGASVVAVMGTVVVPAVGSLRGGSVVLKTSSVGGNVCETGVIGMPGIFWNMMSISFGVLLISRGFSGRRCGLGSKSEMGFSWRLLKGDGVVPCNSSSSSSANTNVSPRAEGGKSSVSDPLCLHRFSSGHRYVSEKQKESFSYSSCHIWPQNQSSSFGNTCTWSHTGTSSLSQIHFHNDPCKTLEAKRGIYDVFVYFFCYSVCSVTNLFPPFNNYIQSDFHWQTLPWGFDTMPLGSCDNVVPY